MFRGQQLAFSFGSMLLILVIARVTAIPQSQQVSELDVPKQNHRKTALLGKDSSVQRTSIQDEPVILTLKNTYYLFLVPLTVLTLVLAWLTRPQTTSPLPEGFRTYAWKYLVVWAIAVGADWLQGPYVYALYESYGFSSAEIAQLFVAGFGSSMVFGTFVGVIADAWGRKRCAVLYCVLYAISCATKHFNSYNVLMLGRVTGGIATSLLFSTFECWMVAQHRKKRFGEDLLRYMFGLMFFVQYLTAIAAGIFAELAADALPLTPVTGHNHMYFGGNTTPFDLSFILLVSVAPLICFLWDENLGDTGSGRQLMASFAAAAGVLQSNSRMVWLGAGVAAFEGSMYCFVFNWTPALESTTIPPPHGLIFSAFMMACMCGSSAFSLLDPITNPSKVLCCIGVVGTSALAIVSGCIGLGEVSIPLVFAGFLVFEGCVGMYFPAMGTLKSQEVPEAARAGVYNAFRVPLNAVVVMLLLTHLSLRWSFAFCCSLLLIMAAGMGMLSQETVDKDPVDKKTDSIINN